MSLITKETPSGTINSSNKVFSTAYTINQIDDIFIDGAVYTGTYTINGKVLTLNAAPTVSLRVDYFTEDPSLVDVGYTPTNTLLKELNDDLKIDKNNKLWTAEEKYSALNWAYFQLQKDLQFKIRECQKQFDITTTPGTREYTLPNNFIHMNEVTYNFQPIWPVEKEELARRQVFQNNVQGTPYQYYLYGSQVGLDPIPAEAKTLSLYMARQLPTLTATQGSILPSQYNLAIIKYASYLIWSGPRGNRQTAQEKATDYKQQVNTLRSAYLLRTSVNAWKPARRKRYGSARSL